MFLENTCDTPVFNTFKIIQDINKIKVRDCSALKVRDHREALKNYSFYYVYITNQRASPFLLLEFCRVTDKSSKFHRKI